MPEKRTATSSFLLSTCIWHILVFLNPLTKCQVDISPSEIQYIPINTLRNITCHVEGGIVANWFIILEDGSEQRINPFLNSMPVPGITGRRITENASTVLITVNTSDTSVIGLRCQGDIIASGTTAVSSSINLTIYGIPDAPTDLNTSAIDNSLTTTWTYRIIPTVTVMFNITLTFLSPSQLGNITVCVTDTDSYTFTLEGVRSCDPFTMCITATNTVGQSHPSCVNNSLPYIPSTNDIRYSLFREGNSNSLNLTLQMSQCLEDDSLFYVALLQNLNQNQLLTSLAIPATPDSTTTVITGLFRQSLYNLTIRSSNSLGTGFSETQQFCTNDIQGVTICPTMMDGVFNISCDYVSGCNYSGCSYELSSTNSYINGSIIGMNYTVVSINVNTLYNLTVADFIEEIIIIEKFSVDLISSCFTTEAVTVDTTTTNRINSNNGTVAVAVTIPILIVAFIVALFTIPFVIYLIRNDYCSNCGLFSFQKSKKKKRFTIEYHGSGNSHVIVETKNGNQVDSKKMNMPEEAANDIMYDSLNTVKTKIRNEKSIEENYSQISAMPIYHVLEQEKPVTAPTQETTGTKPTPTEEIPVDNDAPPIPQYNPEGVNNPLISQHNTNHHDSTSVQNIVVTNSLPADAMYAEVGTRSAAKT